MDFCARRLVTGAQMAAVGRGASWLVPGMEERVPETVKGMEEKEMAAAVAVAEMAEAVRPERGPCCGMMRGMRRR